MQKALDAFRAGAFVAVMDPSDREDECDLTIRADMCTPAQMAFMIRHSTGIICVVTNKERLELLKLHPATGSNTDRNATNFYVSTDYLIGTTTGVSASDRAATIRAMCQEKPNAEDFSKPGHMFPLCPKEGGVLERKGHTESAYDLCRLANVKPAVAAIGELMHDDGTMYRYKDSVAFAQRHDIPLITVQDIIDARNCTELKLPVAVSTASCSIAIDGVDALCDLRVYECVGRGIQLVVLVKGDVRGKCNVPVRVHSECFTGDTLGSARCDCGKQLSKFKGIMNQKPCAILVYVRGHEGRGIGLANKIACYGVQDTESLDTVDANVRLGFDVDTRNYSDVPRVLREEIGIRSIKLYTNNPIKVGALKAIVESTETLTSTPTEQNIQYLQTKVQRLGHATELARENKHETSRVEVNGCRLHGS